VLIQDHQNYTSNISIMVTDMMVGSIEVEQELTHGLSIGTMTFDDLEQY